MFLGQEVHYCIVHIAYYTEFNLQICSGPVVAHDLNPHNLVSVYRTEEERKARLVNWKILLLGTTTERVLEQEEVLVVCCLFTMFIFPLPLSSLLIQFQNAEKEEINN